MPRRKDDVGNWEFAVNSGLNGILPMILALIERSKAKDRPQPPQMPPTQGGV